MEGARPWIRIREAMDGGRLGGGVSLRGWVRTARRSKNVAFLNLNDGSNQHGVQVILEPTMPGFEEASRLRAGAAVEARGVMVRSPGAGQALELLAESVRVYGDSPEDYPLQKKGHTLEFLREIAHLRPRTNTFGAVFRVRNLLAYEIHRFFQERGFLLVHTPIITGSDCEGAGEMFRVTTLDPATPPRDAKGGVDWDRDFFAREAGLTVSGQLEGEAFALAFGNVYTFGPTFRAENSNTSRHLAEFWMVEPEMAFHDLADNAALAEAFLRRLLSAALERCGEELEFLAKHYDEGLVGRLEALAAAPFARLTYTQAVEALLAGGRSFEFPVEWGRDLQSEHERWLCEEHCGGPVVVTDYPKEIKAFYMRANDDGRTVAAMDILFPKLGEIVGGAQREDRGDVLRARMEAAGLDPAAYWWYLDLRRYGGAPHSGFGLGFERLVQFVTAMPNIRDAIPFPRTPRHAEF